MVIFIGCCLKHILNIKCWLHVWDKALDRGCAGTIAIQKLIQYLATPVFNDRCQYCTRSINPTVTCAEHLIICKSLPIHSPEHICMAIKNFEDSVFGLSKAISNLLYSFHSIDVHLHVCLYRAYPMMGWNETLNFEMNSCATSGCSESYQIRSLPSLAEQGVATWD